MLARKGQGTIEYLVIIAIVVVIALVVVGLLLQIMGQGGRITESSAKAAWKSGTPFAITDWARSTSSLTLAVRNNSADTLSIVSVCVDSGDCNSDGFANIPAQGTKAVAITVDASGYTCTLVGTKYTLPKAGIYIDYNTSVISSIRQYGYADIVGTC